MRAWVRLSLVFAALCGFATEGLPADRVQPAQQEYQLGRGYRVGESGLTLGGYASAAVEALSQQPWQFQVRDLSLFVIWEQPHWRFFSELETGDALTMGGDGPPVTTSNAYFDLERLYLDLIYDEPLKLRVGKFLTPIGRWNLLHADPLVWTTSRPIVTRGPFALHATGAMLFGNVEILGSRWFYSAYGSGSDQLDFPPPSFSLDRFYENTVGLHFVHEIPGQLGLGLSYAHFRQTKEHPGDKNLFGADLLWIRNRYEISSEFVYRLGTQGPHPDEWGLFVQGVAPIVGHVYAVGRYETFQAEGSGKLQQRGVFGLAYRPLPPLVFKLEYSIGSRDPTASLERFTEGSPGGIPDGFAASVAVLF